MQYLIRDKEYLQHTNTIVYVIYILQLTYIDRQRKVVVNRVSRTPSQLLWNLPDHLKLTARQSRSIKWLISISMSVELEM